jgi:hypothetical protein|tara:strand:+ start:2908 stop:3246 length:339 start_codon:yes stop_codon:yes gene_type:complete
MQKFLKVSHDGMGHLIPINNILGVEKPSGNTKVVIFMNSVGHRATGASEVLGYEITATTASDAAKTKEQLNKLIDLIGEALTTSWTNPVFDITARLPYAVTGIAQIEAEFSV